ncbi:D-glycero-beta-D-manno-heptose 1,7-bisphosphate 7-phosphatase [Tepidiphilus baoligensis]|uniref:D,D-heptose 1,7-bisphosphate phosphatase n=1 Tax=Tepidiphilus baoligensis TaxID=2698687 RepID=A0ABX1QPB7_9PROT|nr:D-glycero-beta-D-manno-heptose 1,7-bisphosphate 7-phosphatase [Tepidiphilus baoligensis]NMH17231.1 D-glycero-beta-D-manno-heptose 1,7-bisphosphate 7-phosphatase [Tepidiphilus baoligensis]
MNGKPAVFLDRDGVINEDRGYVHRWEDFSFLPGAIDALRQLQQKGYLLVVITNQSAVARGLCTEADVLALHERMCAFLRERGIELAGIYHCPHHPQGSVSDYAIACACRKPEPGMILRAAQAHGIDLSRSLLVGDKISDLEAGRAAGIPSLYLVVPPGQDEDLSSLPGVQRVSGLSEVVERMFGSQAMPSS